MDIAVSVNNIPIRLTQERWHHISIGHPEMANYYYKLLETVEKPQIVYRGEHTELLALSEQQPNTDKHIVVVYRELPEAKDGFVITAFLSNKLNYLKKKHIVWKP